MHRRARKIRRTGRHTTPSQVEKVAEMAGKAAPAVAIAGVLVGSATGANAAVVGAASATTVAGQVQTDAVVVHHQPTARSYIVQRGDTLSVIAERFYHNPADWRAIYDANTAKVHNPNVIYVGEKLTIPASAAATSYSPKHAKGGTTLTSSVTHLSGTLGCAALETLWEEGGGSHAEAFTAAEIAMAESGGNQFATGTVGERGYWQINPDHGSLSTYDPLGNAKAAVVISDNGTNWSPWTTYTSGAYRGRC
ncbi:MAG: LysM peptidoglycan-binding domain-containing protein [Streptosporangiaceae bacterium]